MDTKVVKGIEIHLLNKVKAILLENNNRVTDALAVNLSLKKYVQQGGINGECERK